MDIRSFDSLPDPPSGVTSKITPHVIAQSFLDILGILDNARERPFARSKFRLPITASTGILESDAPVGSDLISETDDLTFSE